MMQCMLDTNICIYIIKRKPMEVIERFRLFQISQVCVSSITVSELEYGVIKSSKPAKNHAALAQFMAPIEILPYGDAAAQHYGELRVYLEKHGNPIGALDMLIAAHALSIDCALITNNKKEFERVPHLTIDNWVK